MEVVSILSEGRGWKAVSDVNIIILMEAIPCLTPLPFSFSLFMSQPHQKDMDPVACIYHESRGNFCSRSFSPSLQHFTSILLMFYFVRSQLTGANNPRTDFPGPCLQTIPFLFSPPWSLTPVTFLFPCWCRSSVRFVDSSWWAC